MKPLGDFLICICAQKEHQHLVFQIRQCFLKPPAQQRRVFTLHHKLSGIGLSAPFIPPGTSCSFSRSSYSEEGSSPEQALRTADQPYDCEYKQRRRCERKRRFPRETYEPPKAAPQTPPGPDPPHRWRPAGDAAACAVSWRRNGTPIRRSVLRFPLRQPDGAAHRSVRPGRSCHQGMSRGTTSTPKCIPRPFMPSIRILVLVYPIYHEKSTVFFKMLFNV